MLEQMPRHNLPRSRDLAERRPARASPHPRLQRFPSFQPEVTLFSLSTELSSDNGFDSPRKELRFSRG